MVSRSNQAGRPRVRSSTSTVLVWFSTDAEWQRLMATSV